MLKEAYQRKRLVIWSNAFMPFELLYGLDVIAFHPETLAALAARLGFSHHALSCARAGCYSSDTCSFCRCVAGLTMEGFLPKPDIVISASHLCDAAVKFFHNVSQYYGCEHYLVDIPYHTTESAKRYLSQQLEEIAHSIARKQNKGLNLDKLVNALELSNEARQYMLRINDLCRMLPCPLAGGDATSYVVDAHFFLPGSRVGVSFFKTLYSELKIQSAGNGEIMGKERFRLLWLHHIRPYYPNTIISHLEEVGAPVCFSEANHVYWGPLDVRRPFESLAEKILANPSGGEVERRTILALELVHRYNLDGVIHFSHWGCRQSCGGVSIIRDILQKKGVPLLILHGDGTDGSSYSEEQAKLRLDAFVEMLEAKR
jgi:benzoyl-CoA reductase/2-hydroxyglutaryl-CoA dehydratase subunit BcrC/BadD/HgdB